MYFSECELLADEYPELTGTIKLVDAQFEKMGTVEVLRAEDLTSFLRADLNQVVSVLDLLARDGVLVREEMIECVHCDMASPRSDFRDALDEEGEYRCTSCDRVLTDRTIREMATYRRGEKWTSSASNHESNPATIPLQGVSALGNVDSAVLAALAMNPHAPLLVNEIIGKSGYRDTATKEAIARLKERGLIARPPGTQRQGLVITKPGLEQAKAANSTSGTG